MTEHLREYLVRGGRLNFDVHRSLIDAMTSPTSSDRRAARAVVEEEAVTVGGEDEGDVEHLGVPEALLHPVSDAVVVVLRFDDGERVFS